MLLCRTGLCPQIRQNLGCYIFTLLSLRTWPLRFCKNLLCPAFAHKATIVLPDFVRSCSTDGQERIWLTGYFFIKGVLINMKISLPPFKQRFISYTFYVIYTLLWVNTIKITPSLRHEPDGGLVMLFGFFTAIIFIIITILNAIFQGKDQTKFYLWLILFIIIPPSIFLIIYS